MGRKVFISILGSNDYNECKYDSKKDNYESKNVRFVQEATLEFWKANEWPSDSIAYIFTTRGKRGSYECNWVDNGHRDRETKEIIQCEGLDTRMKKMNLPFPYKQIDIKDGVDEDEIWEIFQVIYDLLSEGDEVYFDITHGFRYIPMLVLPLLNYSKFLKNTTTQKISYGNFELKAKNNDIAPIVNLNSFSDLQDWTKAGSDFIEYGRTSSLQKQILNTDLGIKSSGQFVSLLRKIEGLFYAVRGANIYSGTFFKQLKGQLKGVIKKNKFQPLKAILSKVENKFNHFSTKESVNNGFLAADWCFSHGLLQQACTISQETIISCVCEHCNLNYSKLKVREDIASKLGTSIAFYCGRLEDRGAYAKNKEEYEAFFDLDFVTELALPYSQLSDLRNSYNHAGLVGDHTSDLLKEKYPIYFNNCKKVLAKYKIIETEEKYVTEPVESH